MLCEQCAFFAIWTPTAQTTYIYVEAVGGWISSQDVELAIGAFWAHLGQVGDIRRSGSRPVARPAQGNGAI